MIPLVLSVTFAAGVYLLFTGLTNPHAARPARRNRRFETFLLRAGLSGVTPRAFLLFALSSGIIAGVLAQVLLGWVLVSLVALVLGMLAPVLYYTARHNRRQAAMQVALVEAITRLRDAIRSGLAVPEALVGLAHNGPEILRPEFATLVREMRLSGFEPAMTQMQDRLADPLFDIAGATLILNDRRGGRNVSQVLDQLVQTTRAQQRLQDELRAYQAKNVWSARIIAAVPLVTLVAMRQLNPRYLAFFDDPAGQVVLALCLVSIGLGYAGMLWMTRLPGEKRVLR